MKKSIMLLAITFIACNLFGSWSYSSKIGTDSEGIWKLTFTEFAGTDNLKLTKIEKLLDSSVAADFDLTQFEHDTGKRVVELENGLLRVKFLTSFIAPSVTKINQHLAYENNVITNIEFSADFSEMTGQTNFRSCKKLKRFFPMTIKGLRVLPKETFVSCQSLEGEFSFPDVTNVVESALKDCSKITKLSLPKVRRIDNCSGMTSLTTLEINPDIEEFASQAFRGATNLKDMNTTCFPKLTNIAFYAFFEAKKNCGDWECPNLTNVGEMAFRQNNISSFKAPKLVNVGKNSFSQCTNLKDMEISEDARIINENAFSGCSALTSFTPYFPKNLEILGPAAFRDVKISTPPQIISPYLETLSANCLRGPDYYFNGPLDIYSPITVYGSCALFTAKNGQVINIYSKEVPQRIDSGAFGTKRCRINIKKSAALAGWAKLCEGNESKLESYKTNSDYPGEKTIGLLYTPSSAGCPETWHYVVDDTPPSGTSLVIM